MKIIGPAFCVVVLTGCASARFVEVVAGEAPATSAQAGCEEPCVATPMQGNIAARSAWTGLHIGPSWANITGDFDADYRAGIAATLFGQYQLTPLWYVQPAIAYVQDGFRFQGRFQQVRVDSEGIVHHDQVLLTVALSYFEFSFTPGLSLPVGRFNLFAGAGPLFALKAKGELIEEVETFTSTGGTTFTRSESRNEITIENVRTLDLGVTTAAGVLMRMSRMRVGVIGSFARGLLNTFEDTSGTADGPVLANASGEAPDGKNYRLQVALVLGIALR